MDRHCSGAHRLFWSPRVMCWIPQVVVLDPISAVLEPTGADREPTSVGVKPTGRHYGARRSSRSADRRTSTPEASAQPRGAALKGGYPVSSIVEHPVWMHEHLSSCKNPYSRSGAVGVGKWGRGGRCGVGGRMGGLEGRRRSLKNHLSK